MIVSSSLRSFYTKPVGPDNHKLGQNVNMINQIDDAIPRYPVRDSMEEAIAKLQVREPADMLAPKTR